MSKLSVYQHWDPLKICIVGRSYPPEFYKWITIPRVRSLFEKIAQETEEDYQTIIKKLQEFGVQILRPNLCLDAYIGGRYFPPPMTPRDHMVMIGEIFYKGYQLDLVQFYNGVKDPAWPVIYNNDQFWNLPKLLIDECRDLHHLDQLLDFYSSYDDIYDMIAAKGNTMKSHIGYFTNGALATRIGRDLYFGTLDQDTDIGESVRLLREEFSDYRTHVIHTGGHSDGTFCAVCPGLIISLNDVPTYAHTFPGWEVIYLPAQSWSKVADFLTLKKRNQGKWWIPGFEHDTDVISTVETWMSHWVGYVEETVFDVNMLIVDPKNVIIFNHNDAVFEALDRYGITPHVVPFRHRYFWDGGIHCVTTDLHRQGTMQDYFPERDR